MTRAGNRGYRRQQGVAIITALLLTTLAVTIVASLFWQQQVQVRSIENQRLQLQKQWVLRGALDWAMLILREDARHSTLDTLDEPWAVELAETRLDQYVEDAGTATDVSDAVLSGHVIDAQSRFNLTNLATAGVVDPDLLERIEVGGTRDRGQRGVARGLDLLGLQRGHLHGVEVGVGSGHGVESRNQPPPPANRLAVVDGAWGGVARARALTRAYPGSTAR